VEAAIEIDGLDALQRVGDVDLIDGLVGFVLKDEEAGAFERAAFGVDVDFRVTAVILGWGRSSYFL